MVSQSKDTRDREIRPMNASAQKLAGGLGVCLAG